VLFGVPALGDSQDEEPFPLVRCADFRRAEYSRVNLVAQSEKVCSHFSQPEAHMSSHVLEEGPSWPDFMENPGNIRP
jgi:hypothetical protein